jgi:hypothetical protein
MLTRTPEENFNNFLMRYRPTATRGNAESDSPFNNAAG